MFRYYCTKIFREYISLGFVLYLSSGDVLAVAVLVRFYRIPLRLPFGKFPLPFLTLVEGEDARQQNSGDVLNLMLRDSAVVGELFSPAQVAPPKKYFAAAFSRAAEEWRLERLLPSVLFPFASFLSYPKLKMQPPVKPFSPSASAWCPVSEIVFSL